MKIARRLHYNAPVVLTFFLLSLAAFILNAVTVGWTNRYLFSVYRSSMLDPLFYVRLFCHVLGHSGYAHFSANMMLFLVVGPPLEEKYGSRTLLTGIVLTALISGALQCVFFPGTALLGASGIVFMLVMLSSLAGMKEGGVPLTLILVAVLYLGQEIAAAFSAGDNVSHFTHLVGGVCGTGYGYLVFRKGRTEDARS